MKFLMRPLLKRLEDVMIIAGYLWKKNYVFWNLQNIIKG